MGKKLPPNLGERESCHPLSQPLQGCKVMDRERNFLKFANGSRLMLRSGIRPPPPVASWVAGLNDTTCRYTL